MFRGESLPRRSEFSLLFHGESPASLLQVSQRGFGAQKGGLGIFVPFMLGCKHFWWAGGGTEIKFVAGQTGVVRAPRVGSCGDDEMDRWRNVETERRGGGGAGDGRRGGWGIVLRASKLPERVSFCMRRKCVVVARCTTAQAECLRGGACARIFGFVHPRTVLLGF